MKFSRSLPCLTLAVLLAGLPSAQIGTVLRWQKINEVVGGFTGALDAGDEFGGMGSSVAPLGDLNGDGTLDMVVGAPGDDDGGLDRGALWVLFLKPDLTVLAQQKISQTDGGFGGTLADSGEFGERVANVGDLDGDGVPELAVVSGAPNRLWILFLKPDGTLKAQRENLYTDPVFQPPTRERLFDYGGLCALGDLDGDGLGDIALGSPHDPDGPGPHTGAVWILRLAADGSLKAGHKISQLHGGFSGVLEAGDWFGYSLVQLGDLDGDGNRELGVRAPYGAYRGNFWILHLDANELVVGQTAFGFDDYGLLWPSNYGFGTAYEFAWLGDLDGDGVGELALAFGGHNFPGGPEFDGGIAIAFLRSDGTVKKKVPISHQRGGFGDLPNRSDFGLAVSALGDVDGDGTPELAVSAPDDHETPESDWTGAVWILSLDTSAVRNGSGLNPLTLSETADPVFGTNWSATLDCSGHAPGMAYVFGYSEPSSGGFHFGGELLVGGQRFFLLQAAHASGPTVLSVAVPPFDLSLIDLPIHIQGLCTGAPGMRLSNALDVVVSQ